MYLNTLGFVFVFSAGLRVSPGRSILLSGRRDCFSNCCYSLQIWVSGNWLVHCSWVRLASTCVVGPCTTSVSHLSVLQVICGTLPSAGSLLRSGEGETQRQSQLASSLAGEPQGTRHPQRHMILLFIKATPICCVVVWLPRVTRATLRDAFWVFPLISFFVHSF